MKKTVPTICALLFALAAFAKTPTPEGWLDDCDAALEKAFAAAKATKAPENMEARKKGLIDEQEGRFDMLKQALKAYEEDGDDDDE